MSEHESSSAIANKFNCLFIDWQHRMGFSVPFQFQTVTLNLWPLFNKKKEKKKKAGKYSYFVF